MPRTRAASVNRVSSLFAGASGSSVDGSTPIPRTTTRRNQFALTLRHTFVLPPSRSRSPSGRSATRARPLLPPVGEEGRSHSQARESRCIGNRPSLEGSLSTCGMPDRIMVSRFSPPASKQLLRRTADVRCEFATRKAMRSPSCDLRCLNEFARSERSTLAPRITARMLRYSR